MQEKMQEAFAAFLTRVYGGGVLQEVTSSVGLVVNHYHHEPNPRTGLFEYREAPVILGVQQIGFSGGLAVHAGKCNTCGVIFWQRAGEERQEGESNGNPI